MTKEQKAAALLLLLVVRKIDAMQLSIAYREYYGVHIDWHEFAYWLDDLRARGFLTVKVPGGMTEYTLVDRDFTGVMNALKKRRFENTHELYVFGRQEGTEDYYGPAQLADVPALIERFKSGWIEFFTPTSQGIRQVAHWDGREEKIDVFEPLGRIIYDDYKSYLGGAHADH